MELINNKQCFLDDIGFIVQWCNVGTEVSYHVYLISRAIWCFLKKQGNNPKNEFFLLLSLQSLEVARICKNRKYIF